MGIVVADKLCAKCERVLRFHRGWVVKLCPKHAAAAEMYEALGTCLDAFLEAIRDAVALYEGTPPNS